MAYRVLKQRRPVAEGAEQHGVSRRTVYKWLSRYRAFGEAGLLDGTSTPKVMSHRLGRDWVDLIVELRT